VAITAWPEMTNSEDYVERYKIARSNKMQTYSLHHPVGKDHKKPVLSFYIGHICPILKANRHSLTIFPHFPKMDANRAR